jgi:hypothetical protein
LSGLSGLGLNTNPALASYVYCQCPIHQALLSGRCGAYAGCRNLLVRPVECLCCSSSAGSRSALLGRLLKGGQAGFIGEILVEIYGGHLEDRLKRSQGKSGGESAVVQSPRLRRNRRRCERRRAPDLIKGQRHRRSISGRLKRFYWATEKYRDPLRHNMRGPLYGENR